ncbi:MAG: PPC domain-containing DNA-binding protein [Candidatus Dormibacteraceae bacterium]
MSVQPGQEILTTVAEQVGQKGVSRAVIVSLVGAVGSACISNMPKCDPKSDILTEYEQPMEMSGTGEIKDGNPHIHCVLGLEGDTTISGHLHWAKVDHWFVNVYVMPL